MKNNNNNIVISIIIPVYNVEKYIEECLNSIINQTYKNLEIIVIDDGSTDNSYQVCKHIANKDNRIKLFKKTNSGVSDTRNYGIKKATGDYISFIDADDYLDLKTYEIVIKNIKNYDLLTYNYNRKYCNYIEKCGVSSKQTFTKINAIKKCLNNDNSFSGYLWNKIFLTSIIKKNKITFDSHIAICEDLLFVLEYLKYANKTISLTDYLYNYRMRKSASSKTFNIDRYCTIFNSYKIIIGICNKLNIDEKYLIEYEYLLNYFLYRKVIVDKVDIDKNIIKDYRNVMNYRGLNFKKKKELFLVKKFNFYYRIRNKIMRIFLPKYEMYE